MSNKREVERQFDKLGTLPTTEIPLKSYLIERKRKALLRKIKAQIKDEERASKKYSDLSAEAGLINTEIASEIYKISGEEFVHKTKLEGMYRKLGGELK